MWIGAVAWDSSEMMEREKRRLRAEGYGSCVGAMSVSGDVTGLSKPSIRRIGWLRKW